LKYAEETGYKAHFNIINYTTEEGVSGYVKGVKTSGQKHHFYISNPGFFRILLDNNTAGYTRSGEFTNHIDEYGKLTLRTKQGYPLAGPIILYMNIIKVSQNNEHEIIDTIPIDNFNHDYMSNIIKPYHTAINDKNEYALIFEFDGEKIAKQLNVYDVPYNQLRHYEDAIYTLDKACRNDINISSNAKVNAMLLEESNTEILLVLVRMYYILTMTEDIPNKSFKMLLIKTGIEKYTDDGYLSYIKYIVPFLEYDY
jgi:flagellar basal body rod protein FlgG